MDQSGLLHQRLEGDKLDVFIGKRPSGEHRGRTVFALARRIAGNPERMHLDVRLPNRRNVRRTHAFDRTIYLLYRG